VGGKALRAKLRALNPGKNPRAAIVPALLESMELTLAIAASRKILPGGRGAPKKKILTSRSGTLRRSLGLSASIDQRGLPNFIEGGSRLKYARVHEIGGRFGRAFFPKRAFLAPALHDAQQRFPAIFEKHFARVLKAA
jgi:phage gpG-like protein